MSFSDKPREPRAPRKARPRLSLKMQAIGFLSRREHSRQELRTKLLDSLRRRAREDAAQEAAAEKAAQALAEAWREQTSNGIDDAFAPPAAVRAPEPLSTPARAHTPARDRMSAGAPTEDGGPASARATRPPGPHVRVTARASAGVGAETSVGVGLGAAATTRAALDTLSLADGTPLPSRLLASLAATGDPASDPARSPSTATAGETALADAPSDDDLEHADPEAAIERLLDWLAANNYLSEARFVESRVNARSRKQGTLRIKLELSRHGLALEPEQAAALRETEFARAQALWQRKFGEVAPDARLRAKQARFLAARGFAADVVRRVVGGEEEF
jgi:regulatory protein